MEMKCPHCGEAVPVGDINVKTFCRRCGSAFCVTDLVPESRPACRKPGLEKPEDLEVAREGLDIVITYFWFSFGFIFLLPLCAVWDAFVFSFYRSFTRDVPLFVWFFPIGHVAIGVALTYYTIGKLLNRTVIRAGPGGLSIRHLPLPWPGGKSIPRDAVEQLFCEERVRRGKRGTLFRTYAILAVTREGSRTEFVSGLESRELALFIEQKIETHLHIQDKPARGEMRQFGD